MMPSCGVLISLCVAAVGASAAAAPEDTQSHFAHVASSTADDSRDSTSISHRRAAPPAVTVGGNRNCTFQTYPKQGALLQSRSAVRATLEMYHQNPGAEEYNNDIIVCLFPGVYDVSHEALTFTERDSVPLGGHIRVVWHSVVPGAAVISGGVQLTGWYPVTLGGGAAYAVSIPAGTFAPGMPVRQLWINGVRSARTVVGDVSSALGGMKLWTSADGSAVGFTTGKTIPLSWLNNTNSIEFTWPIVIANWISPRCTVATIGGAFNNITLTSPCGALLYDRAKAKSGGLPPPVTAEAVAELPLGPGVFYHDVTNSILYYALAAGQSEADLEAGAWVAPNEVLVSYNNSNGHEWEGVSFSYATWQQPNTPDGYVDDQSAVFMCTGATPSCDGGQAEPEGSVRITGSSNVSFTACNFSHLGGPYALSIDQGSQHVTVQQSSFFDLSGGFLKLGSITAAYANSTDPSGWDAFATITDNTASDMALEYDGAAGLFAGFVFSADISHNTISDAGYDGVSIGWGWGTTKLAGVGNNTVSYNRIFNVMRLLRDGGGVYCNGWTNPAWLNTVSNNWVDSDEAVFAVFYLDNGASNWLVNDNVATNSSLAWAFFMQGCCNLPAANSTVENFWYSADLAPVNNCAAEGCVVDAATVYNVPKGQAFPPEAQAIMNGAGARPAHPQAV